ncbi:MAG TPA: hypothetical protein VE197_06940 [Mycobacterium sp.]|nr:hypothetical protein [Mycobacterium sp.]
MTVTPAGHARLLRPFTPWFLLRRAGRRASTGRQPAIASGYLRTRILTALSLLTWLDERRISLAQLDQPTLDAWLADALAHCERLAFVVEGGMRADEA